MEQGGYIILVFVFFDSFCEYFFFCGFIISLDDIGGYLECVYMFFEFLFFSLFVNFIYLFIGLFSEYLVNIFYYVKFFDCFVYIVYLNFVMGEQVENCMIKLLYFKDFEIQCFDEGRVMDFDLMDCVVKVVGNFLYCLQFDCNLWWVYLWDVVSWEKLLIEGIYI